MSEPVVMLSHEMLAPVRQPLEAAGFRVAARWTLSEADRANVRVIVHAGEIPLTPEFLETLPSLGLIACVSVGYDGVDVAWCRANGIEVTHAKGLNADDVADHAIGLILASWRSIVAGDRVVREGGWRNDDRMRPRPGLKDRKLGVMGLGAIGEAVAVRAEAFGMQVSWWGPNPKAVRWPQAESLLALAADSDILVVACRADASNRKAVSRDVIEAVGPRGLIVNVARGSVVDEDALIAALKDGRLGRAALDVFEDEPTPAARWADVPNTVLTPHTAGGTVDSIPRMVAQAVENVRLFLAGEPVASPVAA
ncbi:2-hydroxyacid dehydrogenase [Phenylobacterium sp. J426]|uniref:2-hydroxyacid dehydrogenase n=1 Tax=Phenylobacterium sp. J426 TaxID=2898439 RepID=UPI002150ECDF|nr:2-hydroxyacid dehydrogenase [Phenylobacterium sp. J426]MCR5872920.1 2-hydroxyacid dehydrogenase [Phenylobacterium sp. J426]